MIRHLGFKKPIIALTGQALRDDAEKSLQAGCDGHISKPVTKEALKTKESARQFLIDAGIIKEKKETATHNSSAKK